MNTVSTPVKFAEMPVAIAYEFGAEDAQDGKLCIPEQYFIRRIDQVSYAVGFASVAGDSIETLQFTRNI